MRFDDAELTSTYSLAWKVLLNLSILQLWRAYQSRWDQMWAWFRKLQLRSSNLYLNQADCMHKSGNRACQRWRIIAKFWIFVLAEPSDHNSSRPGQILRIFSLQNPTPLRGFVGKFDPPPAPQSKTNTCDFFLPDRSQIKTESIHCLNSFVTLRDAYDYLIMYIYNEKKYLLRI